ncbi:MAG: hypothetical protein ACLQVY_10590 [Limisphaerales bacterium]
MLPALAGGLFGDDLVQRLNQLTPAELPPHAFDTGFVAADSGQLTTVGNHLFDYVHGKEAAARAREYGVAPWWASEDWTAALWRPLTAFTHWLDYRLYPNTPALMHAHSIAWYAVAVFLAATLYRRVAAQSGSEDKIGTSPCAAGLAGFLWLLDKDTYLPVMYVANRGFFVALVFGMLCLHAHIRWRMSKFRVWMWLSVLCLALSLLANEGGASTLAFLLAYALVLETGGWQARLTSLFPAAAVVLAWRAVYAGFGFGVRNFPGYVDPGYSPLLFVKDIVPRANGLLGGQLTGLPPELALAFNPKWQMIAALFFGGFSLVCVFVFWLVARRNGVARFWAVVMLLALVPAATVAPLSKNLGFVALGAFGVMASFLVAFAKAEERAALPVLLRLTAWCLAIWFVAAHVFAAAAARLVLARATPLIPKVAGRACSFDWLGEIGGRDVVVINDPTVLSSMAPFDRAYLRRPLPKTIRNLIPGSMPFEVNRLDASTLVLKARQSDLFDCPAVGRLHPCYACKSANEFLFGERIWRAGERVTNSAFVAEILSVSARGAPCSIAFHFDKPLESEEKVWLYFDWGRWSHARFVLPRLGESVEIAGGQPL